MATTATTDMMSLSTRPLKSASSSLLKTNTQRQPYKYNGSSAGKSFDKVFEKYNDAPASTNNDVKDMYSDTAQETKEAVTAVVSTSAQGKSKNTQDAPQKETPSAEEVNEIEEVEDQSNPKKIVIMNMFVPLNVENPNFNAANANISEEVDNNANLMTILPQSQESNDKNQDMLNLLAGRTWKINSQNQSVNQIEGQNNPTFMEDLSAQLGSQQTQFAGNVSAMPVNQQPQVQNVLSTGNTVLMEQNPIVQSNILEVHSEMPLNNADINPDEALNQTNNLVDPLPTASGQNENLNPLLSNENPLLNANVQTEVPIQNLNEKLLGSQTEQQNTPLTDLNIDKTQQQLSQEQLPGQNDIDNLISTKQEVLNIPVQQSQSQSTVQNGNQSFNQNLNTLQSSNSSVDGQNQPILQNNEPVQNPEQADQAQLQQFTYQPQQRQLHSVQNQQIQPTAQAENVEMPQVQAAIAENQPSILSRQQTIPSNFTDILNANTELEQSQTINPSQQVLQQQSQNQQQQQNFQSQMQQSVPNAEAESSANTEQQTSTENFAANLGAAVNNTSNDTSINNISNEQPQQADQTARQENITAQIVEHAKMIRNAENTEMVIQLKPEHLGELTLRVSATSNGSVNVTFHSENAQVRAMIENTLVQLKQELSNQGLKVENVQVSAHLSDGGMMNGRGQQAWEQNQRSGSNSRIGRIDRTEGGTLTAAEEAEMVSTAIPENVVSADSVDYRV